MIRSVRVRDGDYDLASSLRMGKMMRRKSSIVKSDSGQEVAKGRQLANHLESKARRVTEGAVL